MSKYKLNCFYMQYKPNDIVELTDQQVIDLSSHIEKVEVIDKEEKNIPKGDTSKKTSDKTDEVSDKQGSPEKVQEVITPKKAKNSRKGAKLSTTKKSASRD